tara:strand:+ start:55 stop:423 length:369 start_codon:yes stop_codon:yes gene_type:complete
MTDRPTHPLTKEAYLTIVNDADIRPETNAFFEVNFHIINATTHKMAVDAACNTRWYGEIREWTDEGAKAMNAVITAVACCATYHIESTLPMYMPYDSHELIKALVGDRYRAWRMPSETYMCQ